MAKDASDLLTNPANIAKAPSKPDAPVSVVLKNLMTTEGKELEILTRTNPNLANAAQIGFIFASIYGSKYVAARVELIERLAISMEGKGREEQISALQAGGKLPDAYFDKQKSAEFTEAR
jgi:hypothetical protein